MTTATRIRLAMASLGSSSKRTVEEEDGAAEGAAAGAGRLAGALAGAAGEPTKMSREPSPPTLGEARRGQAKTGLA